MVVSLFLAPLEGPMALPFRVAARDPAGGIPPARTRERLEMIPRVTRHLFAARTRAALSGGFQCYSPGAERRSTELQAQPKSETVRLGQSLTSSCSFRRALGASLGHWSSSSSAGKGQLSDISTKDEGQPCSWRVAVATRFIDERVMEIVGNEGLEVHQVVMLTAGTDLRPYRLPWPLRTLLFDVSAPERYSKTAERLKASGVRPPRGSLLRHVSVDLAQGDDWCDEGGGEKLQRLGYQGTRPSVWLLQGMDDLSPAGLQAILGHTSILAMRGTLMVGELPLGALGIETLSSTEDAVPRVEAVFAQHGFVVHCQSHSAVAVSLGMAPADVDSTAVKHLLFTATQGRLSEAQVEEARREIALAEEEGDEMGFEDMA